MGKEHRIRALGLSLLLTLLAMQVLGVALHSNIRTDYYNHASSESSETDDVPWLDGWNYRKAHLLLGSVGCEENYQVRIIVNYGIGSDSVDTVYLSEKCKENFTDIRFTDDDGFSLLDYWVERVTIGVEAVFWVEVQDNLDFNASIYLYYGKTDAVSSSNGDDTFLFFDHFYGDSLNLTNWYEWYSNGTIEVSDSNLVVTGGSGTWEQLGCKSQWNDNISVHYFTKWDEQNFVQVGIDDRTKDGVFQGSAYSESGFRYSSNDGNYVYRSHHDGFTTKTSRSYSISSYTHISLNWHSGVYTKYYVNDVLDATISTNVPSDLMGVSFSAREVSTNVWVDWVFVSKHNPEGEPTHYLWDIGEYSVQVDSFAPQIDSPLDIQYEGGTTGHFITWTPEDTYPDAYELRIDGDMVESGNWIGSSITVSIDGLGFGEHECNLTVFDEKGNSVSDEVQVQVIDTTNPIVSSPDNIIYVQYTTGNLIQWTISDFSPSSFIILRNGTIVASGPWATSPQNLSINIDGLSPGIYEYVITIQDRAGNAATDTINVEVLPSDNTIFLGLGIGLIAIVVIIGGVVCYQKR